jgi:hypothetical protein
MDTITITFTVREAGALVATLDANIDVLNLILQGNCPNRSATKEFLNACKTSMEKVTVALSSVPTPEEGEHDTGG